MPPLSILTKKHFLNFKLILELYVSDFSDSHFILLILLWGGLEKFPFLLASDQQELQLRSSYAQAADQMAFNTNTESDGAVLKSRASNAQT